MPGFNIGSQAEGAATKVIALVVVLGILGGTIGDVFTNLTTVLGEFTGVLTGVPVLDSIISGGLALLVGFMVAFGIVKLIKRVSGSSAA